MACAALLLISLQLCTAGALTASSKTLVRRDEVAATRQLSISYDSLQGFETNPSSVVLPGPLMRTSLEVPGQTSSVYSGLLLALIFPMVIVALGCAAQFFSSPQLWKAWCASWKASMMQKLDTNVDGQVSKANVAAVPGIRSPQQIAQRRVLWHLLEERPLFAPKATAQTAISEGNLPDYIETHFEHDCDAMSELKQVLQQRLRGESTGNGWWSWSHPKPLATPMPELMAQFHCDGLLDWSQIPSSFLAHKYMQIIVTSGLGTQAMFSEGAEEDWLESMHRDTFWDWTARGMKHLFFSKVDTMLVGCVGRKRVVLLPPQALPGKSLTSGSVNWRGCDDAIKAICKMNREDGWTALEQYAAGAGGATFTVCPGTTCHIPADWWHIVRPLDEVTAVLSPSFLRGSWAQLQFES